MSGLHLLPAKTVRWGQRAHCSSPPHLGSIGFIQEATGQEDLIQSCDAPLQRGLPEQCCGKWTPSTYTARAALPAHTSSTQTHVQTHGVLIHTQTKENYFLFCLSHLHSSLANLVIVYSPMISFTHTCTHKQTVTHYTQGYCYASYRVHITHSLSCQIMQSPIICSSMSCFKPSHTIITTLHSVTRKTWSPAQSNAHQCDHRVVYATLSSMAILRPCLLVVFNDFCFIERCFCRSNFCLLIAR